MTRESQFLGSLALALCLGALTATNLAGRTFTDAKGRTIEAEVTAATETEVTIKRADGKEFTVALSTFSDADQEFVKKWREAKAAEGDPGESEEGGQSAAPAVDEEKGEEAEVAPVKVLDELRLGYRIKKEKTSSQKIGKDKTRAMYRYVVEIDNKSSDPITGVRVKCEMFIRFYDKHADPKRGVARTEEGELKLKPVAARKRLSFPTKSVGINTDKSRTLNGDIVTSYQYEEDLAGLILTFYQGKRQIGEYTYGRTKRK
jgi:hypothetical protein